MPPTSRSWPLVSSSEHARLVTVSDSLRSFFRVRCLSRSASSLAPVGQQSADAPTGTRSAGPRCIQYRVDPSPPPSARWSAGHRSGDRYLPLRTEARLDSANVRGLVPEQAGPPLRPTPLPQTHAPAGRCDAQLRAKATTLDGCSSVAFAESLGAVGGCSLGLWCDDRSPHRRMVINRVHPRTTHLTHCSRYSRVAGDQQAA